MAPWVKILLDLSVLAALGLLYYFVQRRRIIKSDLSEIFHFIEKNIFKAHEFLDTKKENEQYKLMNSFVEGLEKSLETADVKLLNSYLQQIPKGFPKEIKDELNSIKENISIHIK